ncbi:PEBP-like protein [Xylaria intraflava]|nr:PEBP-like protein [Xylaria intraflava]
MLPKTLIALAASVSGVLASTPPNFKPDSQASFLVVYGEESAANGAVIDKELTGKAPTIASYIKLEGTSFAVMMIDLDVPTDNPPRTDTYLNWLQTGLTQDSTGSMLNITTGSQYVYVFSVPQNEGAFASYTGPDPPAKIPLTHRYTELLIDTSNASEDDLADLKAAAATRECFNASSVLESVGLVDKVIAGNYFNVTNPGPVVIEAAPSPPAGNDDDGKSSTPSKNPPTGEAVSQNAPLVAILMVGIAFFAL